MKINEKVVNRYFEYQKIRLKKTTFENKIPNFNKYIFGYFKGKKIKKIGFNDIIEWKKYINNCNLKHNSKTTLYHMLTSFFDFLEKFYKLKKNYARIEGNFVKTDFTINGQYWTLDEFNKFINSVDDFKLNVFFRLLFFSGMRKGEILALTWNNIDDINNRIYINKTITRNHEIVATKTYSSIRIITINSDIINDLKKIKKSNSDLIFDFSFTTIKRKKDYYCNLSGVKQIKIHEFRHSHAIFLYLNKIPIDEIQQRLGHSDMSTTTDIYLKLLPRQEKRVIKLLNSTNC